MGGSTSVPNVTFAFDGDSPNKLMGTTTAMQCSSAVVTDCDGTKGLLVFEDREVKLEYVW